LQTLKLVTLYYCLGYEPVSILWLLKNMEKELSILLIRCGGHPYLGHWALPGGFVNPDERVGEAAKRELAEELGCRTGIGSSSTPEALRVAGHRLASKFQTRERVRGLMQPLRETGWPYTASLPEGWVEI